MGVERASRKVFLCSALVLIFVLFGTSTLFFETSPQTRVSLSLSGLYFSEIASSNEEARRFLEQDSHQMYYFLSDIMDVFCLAGRDQQAEQSNYLTEGQILL
eukprot:371295-Pelagomonas_calceolata.AAC.1